MSVVPFQPAIPRYPACFRFFNPMVLRLLTVFTAVGLCVLPACVSRPGLQHDASGRAVLAPSELPNVTRVEDLLMTLVPSGDPAEAHLIAATAVLNGAVCAERYNVTVGPAEHNWMVNRGLRDRGLCWQWTWDMAAALAPLQAKTFDLHWGISNDGKFNEHNSIVVTARGQPFATGITLDPWRSSGYVTAVPVTDDREYKWNERRSPAGAANIYRKGQ